jgi:hypothetical protein
MTANSDRHRCMCVCIASVAPAKQAKLAYSTAATVCWLERTWGAPVAALPIKTS